MSDVQRELKHSRHITSHGYSRSDGLWEVKATMKDIKAHDVYRDFDGSLVAQGDPFHDISVNLVLDDTFVVQAIKVSIDAHPFPNCSHAEPNFSRIVGSRIGPGWSSFLKQELRGKSGCTHVLELLPVAATTAFQMMWSPLAEKYPQHRGKVIQSLVNTCKGWAEDSPAIIKLKAEEPDLFN
ncbi:DUF2889 domain-containing protein [Marinomonas agarivorans]|nr:DUF2889 domain-containing protein [Marinomonas agarivorans]